MSNKSKERPPWLNGLMQTTLGGFAYIDQDYNFGDINTAGLKILSLKEDQLQNLSFLKILCEHDQNLFHFYLKKIAENNTELPPIEIKVIKPVERTLQLKAQLWPQEFDSFGEFSTKYLLSFLDITDQKASDKMLSFFAQATQDIGSSLNWQETQHKMLDLVIPRLADWCSIKILNTKHQLSEVTQKGKKGFNLEAFSQMQSNELSEVHTLKSGTSIFIEQLNQEQIESLCETPKQYNALIENGLCSYICVPLFLRKLPMGTVSLLKSTPFTLEDKVIAEELANRFAIAADNAKMYNDLSEAQETIQEAKKHAESANKAKSEFLANMSHEIRTPLGAILGFADLMLNPDEPEKNFKVWGQKIKRNGLHLLHIIDEILDLSKIESGKMSVQFQSVNLVQILNEVSNLVAPQVAKKLLTFSFSFDSEIPQLIKTDPMKLKQILINLVGNAVKFTETGTINVSLLFYKETSLLEFYITDTGIGLTAEQAKNLFQPFSQGDASHTRRFGGTGLGLSLSKRLAKFLGGDISLVHTSPNKGTCFKVFIEAEALPDTPYISKLSSRPEEEPRESLQEDYKKIDLSGIKILLIEDSKDNQILIHRFLTGPGAEVEIANDGKVGMEKALADNYDVILMDIQMPILNGYEACEQLRKQGYHKPIVALTAHALKEEKEKSMAVGFDDHLSKPIDRLTLLNTVKLMASKK